MTTKLYFHGASNAAAGTYPAGEQSSATPSWSATGAATLRTMNTTIGTAQTSLSGTSLANTGLQLPFMGHFTSPPLNGTQEITGSLRLNVALTQSNTQMNLGQYLSTCLYVWRPSTGVVVGKLYEGPGNQIAVTGAAAPSAANTEKVDWGSVSGASTMVTALDGDVLICEVWPAFIQGTAAAYTATFFFDGTTENTTLNATVSNHAAFVEVDENLVFKTAAAALQAAPSSVCAGTAALTTAIRPKANAADQVTATSSLTTAIRPKANGSSATTVSAAFTTAIRPKANGSSSTTISAAFTTAIRPKADAAVQVSAGAALTTAIPLQSSAHGVSAATAHLSTQNRMSATANGQVTATSTLTTQIQFKANASGQSEATARLAAATAGLRAILLDQTAATAGLTTRIALKSNQQSRTTATARLTTTGALSPAEFTASATVLTSVAVVGAVAVPPLVVSTTTRASFSATVDIA